LVFESKEAFLSEALSDLWNEWVLWGYDGRPVAADFETVLDVCRRLFRVNKRKTLFGRVLKKTFGNSTFVLDSLLAASTPAFMAVAPQSSVEIDDFDTRFAMFTACLVGIFQGVFVSEKFSPDDADKALRVSLSIWNLNQSQAEQLTSQPISV
jgi:hypothetical protein